MTDEQQEVLDILTDALRKIAEFDDLCIEGGAIAEEYSGLAFSQLAQIAIDALSSAGIPLAVQE